MEPRITFGINVLMSAVSWVVIAKLYVWPWLRTVGRHNALIRLVVPHMFLRFIGLSFIIPGVVSPLLPPAFAIRCVGRLRWSHDALFLKQQPGCISAQLHRGIAGGGVFVNVAVWQSVADFRQAFSSPEFRGSLDAYPPSTIAAPHLFQKIAVPNICVA